MRGDLAFLAAVVAAGVYAGKRLLEPVLTRLGDRLAGWIVPDDRSAGFRVAKGLAHVARLVAPRRSAARRAAEATLAEIDQVTWAAAKPVPVVPIALSIIAPAFGARLRWTAEWAWFYLTMCGWGIVFLLPPMSILMLLEFGRGAVRGKGTSLSHEQPYEGLARWTAGAYCAAFPGAVVAGVAMVHGGWQTMGLALAGLGAFPLIALSLLLVSAGMDTVREARGR